MKNITLLKKLVCVLFLIIGTKSIYAQIKNPFDIRFQSTVRGDLTMISNNIVNRSPNPNSPYNATGSSSSYNDNVNMQFIDIDGNNQTFNSSSADLTIPNATCSNIVHAGLYWSATYRYNIGNDPSSGRATDWNQVKFRVPGGTYVDVVADEVLYNGFADPNQTNVAHGPYGCFADVTALISGLADPNGTYFVGNIRVSQDGSGSSSYPIPGGIAGGWTLVIVYENITLPGKKITTFDGYAIVASNAGNLDIPVSGFSTLPAPFPVRAKLGISTLEGDNRITGDRLQIKANSIATFTNLINTPPPAAPVNNNYFNSSITLNGAFNNARNPNSLNTLGWDAHLNAINNPANSVIPNNETGVTLRAITTGDKYDVFFTSFDVEIIEPQIPLIKEVEDTAGNNINNQTLALGQELFYTLTFQNTGNDNAVNFTITDVLPTNAIFPANGTIQPGDLILPPGVTYTFDASTNQFTFTIPDNLVEIGDPAYTISIKVKLPSTCQDFRDACSNQIINQAFITYSGVLNTQVITDNPSYSGYDSCNYPTPGTTNFIADIADCVFTRNEVLCGSTVDLTAPDGYDTYLWQDAAGNNIGNTQTITVSSTGVYTVFLSIPPPCVSIFETVTVIDFNNAINTNPVTPYADVVEICPNDGSELPKIFLCGVGDSQLIQTGINDAVSIEWQMLVPGSCPPVGINNCANTNPSCAWNTVGTGPNFNVTTAGEYQVIISYQNGCFRKFFFNVYQNVLNPDIVTTNIICNTPGTITINNIPSTYEFSLSPNGPFQTSNTFDITTAGVYTVYIQQIGVSGGCLFEYPNVNILSQDIDVDVIVTDKLCNDGFGSIRVQINGVNPQYYFQISQGSTTIGTYGPSIDNDHLFSNLNPGNYTVTATTDDGCTYTQQVTIQNLSDLTLVATVSQHIGCNQGNIQVNPSGGNPPYNYAIYSYNGVLVNPVDYQYQTSVIFDVQIGDQGDYQFLVIDSNNCVSISNTVTINLEPPVALSETHTNVTCNGLNNGIITIQTGPTNGYNVSYSIDGGTNYQSSNVFNNLAPGTYTINVKFTKGNRVCEYTITVVITEPPVLVGQSELVESLTCITTGTIQAINVSGGTAPYQYSINGVTFQNSNIFTNLNAGTYTITIKDANNCTITTNPITFVNPLPPTDLTFASTSLTCPGLTSTITATITGGTAPYTAQITAPSIINATSIVGNIATFNNIVVGSYTFVVTDANGCTYQENFTINPIPFINVTGNLVSNVVCFGTSTGAVNFNVSNFSTSYSYSINGAAPITNQTSATINLTNLAPGNYAIVVTDTNTNCQSTANVTVAQPTNALALNTTVNPITCIANGSIIATATGGWGSFAYTLTLPDATIVGPQNNGIFNNLTQSGSYTITVTDANGCTITNNATLSTPIAPTLVINPTSTLCYNTSTAATIIVTAASGNPPYQYSINGSAYQTSNTFNGLTPGTYTITVQDSFGCIATVNQIITPAILAQTVITKGLDCSTSPDAIITINLNGGTTPYQYQVNVNNAGYGTANPITGNSFTFNTANPGNYQFLITDAAGCTFTTNVITINPITSPNIISITQTQQNLCNGDSNGAFVVNIDSTQGTSPFQYSIDGGITYQNSNTFTNLTAGTYNVIVKDANQCTDNQIITLNQPDIINYNISITEITCNNPGGTNFGEILIENVSGGSAPYTYYLTNNFGYSESYVTTSNEDHAFIILNFGIYTAEVIDNNGCSIIINNIVIASPPDDLDIDISTATADCILGGTAIITVSTLVSSGSYEFGILETNSIPYSTSYQLADVGTPETSTFTGLVPGVTYTFVVHDLITNCYYFETANGPIPTPSNLTTTINVIQNVTCTGNGDGSVSFTFDNYDSTTTSVSYEIFNAQSNISTGLIGNSVVTGGPITVSNFGMLPPGIYYILLTENGSGSANGCTTTTQNFTITQSTNPLNVIANLIKNDNCNLNAGIVTATGQFGTAPYEYQILWSTDPAPTAGTWAGTSTNTFNVESGSYIVYVKDANNCIAASAIVVVGLDPTPEITLSINDNCANEGSFTIDVIRTLDGIAPYTYVVDGGSPFTQNAASFAINNLLSGTHTVTITDSNGCSFTQTISIDQTINVTASIATQPSCANNDGQIQATATNGSGNYAFELQDTSGNTISGPNVTGLFNGLGYGNYNVIISDVTNGCSFSIPIALEQPVAVIFTTTHQNISCYGASDGSISVILDPTNTDTPYSYTLFDGTTTTTQNTPIFTGLPAGSYTITVTSAKNCTGTQTIIITEPNALTLNLTANEFACNSNNNVSVVTVTATVGNATGTAPYLYSIDGTNFQANNTFDIIDNGSIQTISITVADANGCLITDTITINPLPTITNVNVTQNIALTCANDEEVLITVTGGSGNYTYQLLPNGTIVGPTTSNTATFNLNAPGSYTFEIIDVTTGCSTITTPYTINPLGIITAIADNAVAVNCFGDTNGAFDITVSGYNGNYQYNIFDDTNILISTGNSNTSTNPLTLNNIAAGNYIVQIIATDTPYCETFTNSITIGSPANALTLLVQQTAEVTCNIPGLGTIIAEANGGNGSYEFQLVNTLTNTIIQVFGPNNVFTNLDGGTYEITVRDINLCETSQIITLTSPTPINATYIVSNLNLLCNNDTNGSVIITATGGQGSYQYILTDDMGNISGPQIQNTFTGLGAGTYTISVTDGWDCDFIALPFTITEPTPIQATLSIQNTLTCLNNAQLIITASGGIPPYQYSIDGTTFNSINTFNVGPGTYQYYVTDSNGCSAITSNQVTIEPIEPLQITINTSNTSIQCNGDTNASITADVTGGLGNYSYSLLNGTTLTVITGPQNSNIFNGLGAGNYIIQVNSEDCFINSSNIIITQPTNSLNISNYIVNPVSCNGNADGSISFFPSGGTPPYQYAITTHLDQFFNTNTFTGLNVGTYTVIVQDANGCFESITVQITEPAPLNATALNVFEVCEGSNNGTSSLTITGGTAPYFTSLDDDTPGNFIQGQLVFTNLDNTVEHIIYIHDANNCQFVITIPAGNPVTLNPTVDTVIYGCTSTGALQNNTVTVNVEASNQGQVQYSLDNQTNYQSNNVYTNLTNGTHTIYVKHTNGCVKTITVNITNRIPLLETHSKVDILCNGSTTGSITINATGGDGNYQYAISPSFTFVSTNEFNNLAAGNYTIKVKDGLGCEIETNLITINEPSALNLVASAIGQEICEGDDNGYIQITISGGVGSYMASFNNTSNYVAVGTSNIVDYFDLSGGTTYTIYIKDANGCTTSIPVSLDDAVDLKPIVNVNYSCSNNQSTNSVTITVDPQYANEVTYSIDGINYQLNNTFEDVLPGNYTAYVEHINGCLNANETFSIDQIDPVSVILLETGLNQITATASGGVPPYTYVFNGINTGSNNVFYISQTGNQTVIVYDSNSNACNATATIPVTFYPIEIPNFFTPDGNGFNDFWTPINIENYTNLESLIFDRYGREIIRLKVGETWDGTYESIDLPSGDYWYLINVNDGSGKAFTGNFTLYR